MTKLETVPAVIAGIVSLISDPACFAAGNVEARDVQGNPVRPTNPRAVQWSIGGAVECLIDVDGVREDGDDAEHAEWSRRSALAAETYRALGITTDRPDGGLVRHDIVMLVLSHARAA